MTIDKTVLDVLRPLSMVDEPGLPLDIWLDIINAFSRKYGRTYSINDLNAARKAAVDFLVQESSIDGGSFRLFHQEVGRIIQLSTDKNLDSEQILANRLLAWSDNEGDLRYARPYLRQSLASHLDRADLLSDKLSDPRFLLGSDPVVLRGLAGQRRNPRDAQHLMAFLLSRPEAGGNEADRAARLALCAQLVGDHELAAHAGSLELGFYTTWVQDGNHTPGFTLTKRATGWAGWVVANIDRRPVVVAGNYDGSIRTYYLDTGQPAREPIATGSGTVFSLALVTRNSRWIVVSGNYDGSVHQYDLDSGEEICRPIETKGGSAVKIFAVQSGRDAVIVIGGSDGRLRAYSLDSCGQLVSPISVQGRAFTFQLRRHVGDLVGRILAVIGTESGVIEGRLLGAMDRCEYDYDPGYGGVSAIDSIALSSRVAVVAGHTSGAVTAHFLETGEAICPAIEVENSPVVEVNVSVQSGSSLIIVASHGDGTLHTYNLGSGDALTSPIQTGAGPSFAISHVDLEGRSTLVVGTYCGAIARYYLDEPGFTPSPSKYRPPVGPVWALERTELQGQPVIAVGSYDGHIHLFDIATGEPAAAPVDTGGGPVWALSEIDASDGKALVAGSYDGGIRAFRVASGEPISDKLQTGGGFVEAIAISRLDNEDIVSAATFDGCVRSYGLWSADQTMEVHTGGGAALGLADFYAPEGASVVVGSEDGTIHSFGLESGRPVLAPIQAGAGAVEPLLVYRVEERPVVIAGCEDGTIRRYYLDTGDVAADPIRTGSGAVLALCLSELDDRVVVTATTNSGGIHRYFLDSGTSAGTALVHGHRLLAVYSEGLDVVVSLSGPLARLSVPRVGVEVDTAVDLVQTRRNPG